MNGQTSYSRPIRKWVGLLCLALGLCCAATGAAQELPLRGYTADGGWQYVELGVFPQTVEGGLEPIVWRVLTVHEQQAYLVSEYVLLNRRIHPDDVAYAASGGDFSGTELSAYLNGAFLDSFSAAEQAALVPVEGQRVTLLTADELRSAALGFTNDAARAALGTPWALQNGLFQYGSSYGGTSPYWTRTPYDGQAYAACCTKARGNFGWIRVGVLNEGCRPACTLNLHGVSLESGRGDRSDPFRLTLDEGRVQQ